MNIYIESANLNKQIVNFSDGSYLDFQIVLINNNKGEPVALKTDNLFFEEMNKKGKSIHFEIKNDSLKVGKDTLIFK